MQKLYESTQSPARAEAMVHSKCHDAATLYYLHHNHRWSSLVYQHRPAHVNLQGRAKAVGASSANLSPPRDSVITGQAVFKKKFSFECCFLTFGLFVSHTDTVVLYCITYSLTK